MYTVSLLLALLLALTAGIPQFEADGQEEIVDPVPTSSTDEGVEPPASRRESFNTPVHTSRIDQGVEPPVSRREGAFNTPVHTSRRHQGVEPPAQSSRNQEFNCVEDGVYEDPNQCDKYWVCEGGQAIPKLCDDGLVFDLLKAEAGGVDPCEYPYVVDCGSRTFLQNATYPSKYCPRRNGIFSDPDPAVCTRFYTCIKGLHTVTDCTSGLHFDEQTGICNWPEQVARSGCEEDKMAACTNNGAFCCTGERVINAAGVELPHPTYINPDDCQKFYVCLNGQTPQESSCSLGQVYNEQTTMCDFPENVPECKGWYKDHPEFAEYYYEDTNLGSDSGTEDTPA
ncbi:protein obstructor-E isoform X3 [Cherax quadricarinatus]